jgi:L-2,4-diaminobutyrate decarboxylase
LPSLPSFDDESRALAHRVIDSIFDHIQNIGERPVVDFTAPEALARMVRSDAGYLELVSLLTSKSIQLHHPAYMGHQVCPPIPQAVIADFVISALNQSNAVWEMSPFATVVEKELMRWLADQVGYPAESAGTAVSGGSAANLTALLAARARWTTERGKTSAKPIVICSADAHYSVARAAVILGLPKESIITVPTDDHHRIDRAALEKVLESGIDPMAIVATSGSTATGSFDDLVALTDLRNRYQTWLHVDAAHGASLLLSAKLRHLVEGLGAADSLSWDPHKMMWMPLSMGAVLVRDARWLRAAFQADAPYLFDARQSDWNIGETTIQCSKRSDIVKLWLTLKTVGIEPIASALEHVTAVTRHLYERVRDSQDFEALHKPQFNIFCFRYRGDGSQSNLDALNQSIRDRVIRGGKAWITTTVLKGVRALRVTLINPRTGERDVETLLDLVRQVAGD